VTGRQLGAIFGVLAALLAGWFLVRGRTAGSDPADGLDLGALVGPDVAYIHIDSPDAGPIELVRRADGWTVNGYPALDSLVDATLGRLDTLPPGRLIARNPASHERMELTDEAAVRVRVGPAGLPVADFLVGGAGLDGRFVRLPDTDAAYILPRGVMDALVAPERSWRDFTIVRADTASLRRVVIRRGDGIAAELNRAEGEAAGGWTVNGPATDGAATDTTVMRVYLEALADLQGTGFPADSFVYAADFENPIAVVELYAGEDGVRVPDTALLFSTGLGHPDVLVRRADDPIVYSVDRPTANLLTSGVERLLGR